MTAACAAGILIGLARQVNGRLSLVTSPLVASTWSHLIGLFALSAAGIWLGNLFPHGSAEAPWYTYLGGPLSVAYVVCGSWSIVRIGAARTALLIVSGQLASGVAIDIAHSLHSSSWLLFLGVVLICIGVVLMQDRQ